LEKINYNMKIWLRVGTDECDSIHHSLVINDKCATGWEIYALNECPEDAIIGRRLIDGYDLIEAITLGYEAAKQGELLEINIIKDQEEK
jgi:hypothetical protein